MKTLAKLEDELDVLWGWIFLISIIGLVITAVITITVIRTGIPSQGVTIGIVLLSIRFLHIGGGLYLMTRNVSQQIERKKYRGSG